MSAPSQGNEIVMPEARRWTLMKYGSGNTAIGPLIAHGESVEGIEAAPVEARIAELEERVRAITLGAAESESWLRERREEAEADVERLRAVERAAKALLVTCSYAYVDALPELEDFEKAQDALSAALTSPAGGDIDA